MAPRTKEENLKILEQTRQKIVMAALKAFGEKGYSSTTVSQIAKEAGISKGLIYHYFSGKEDVLKGIFDMMVVEGQSLMEDWEKKTPKEQLRQLITGSIHFMKAQPHIMRFMTALAIQPAVMANLEEVLEAQKNGMMKQYEQTFEQLGYDDPELEAYYLGAFLDGTGLGFMVIKDYPIDKMEQKLLKRYNL